MRDRGSTPGMLRPPSWSTRWCKRKPPGLVSTCCRTWRGSRRRRQCRHRRASRLSHRRTRWWRQWTKPRRHKHGDERKARSWAHPSLDASRANPLTSKGPRYPHRRAEPPPAIRRRLPRVPRAGGRPGRRRPRQRGGVRGSTPARRAPRRDRPREEHLLHEHQPRVPHAPGAHPQGDQRRRRGLGWSVSAVANATLSSLTDASRAAAFGTARRGHRTMRRPLPHQHACGASRARKGRGRGRGELNQMTQLSGANRGELFHRVRQRLPAPGRPSPS